MTVNGALKNDGSGLILFVRVLQEECLNKWHHVLRHTELSAVQQGKIVNLLLWIE